VTGSRVKLKADSKMKEGNKPTIHGHQCYTPVGWKKWIPGGLRGKPGSSGAVTSGQGSCSQGSYERCRQTKQLLQCCVSPGDKGEWERAQVWLVIAPSQVGHCPGKPTFVIFKEAHRGPGHVFRDQRSRSAFNQYLFCMGIA
jgi:hypothetical protein